MANYAEIATGIIEAIGGKENIKDVTHCATRLRFHLKDENKANDEQVEKVKGVLKVVKSGGQYQIVIGPQVASVYAEVLKTGGVVGGGAVEATEADAKDDAKKQGIGAVILDYISSMMGPIIMLVCGCGIIKGIASLLTISGVLTTTDTLYMIINAAGDCVYYFMPIFFGYTLSKKADINPVVGMALGAILVYPDLQNMQGSVLFGIDISGITYKQTMLPILVSVLAAAPFDHWLKRVLPDSVSGFMEPVILLFVAAPIMFVVIGPITTIVSNAIANFVQFLLGFSPVLAGAVVCGLWQVLVLFGVHAVLATVIFTLMFTTGSSMLYPLTCIPAFAVFGIVTAMFIRTRNKKTKETALSCIPTSFLGITEPSMYGLLLTNVKYFVITCIISAISGAYMGITGVTAYQLGGSGLLCLAIAANGSDVSGIMNFAIAIAFATVAGFVVTMVTYRDPKPTSETDESEAAAE